MLVHKLGPRLLCGMLAGLGLLLAAMWATAAALMTTRGYGGANEGFYLTSYRWWAVDPRDFVGSQYIYGPIFHALGSSVPAMRAVRLVSVLVIHAFFGVNFMRWLRIQRPQAPSTRLWETAGTLLITASGGVAYGWLPGVPGYNDVALLGSLALAGLLMLWFVWYQSGRRSRQCVPPVLGAVAFAMILSKFSLAAAVIGILALGTWAVRRTDPRATGAFLGLVGSGALATALLFSLLVKPLQAVVPPIVASVSVVAGSSHPIGEIVQFYAITGLHVAFVAALLAAPVLALIYTARKTRFGGAATVGAYALLAVETCLFLWTNGLAGGTTHVFGYSVMITALVVVAGTVRPPTFLRSPGSHAFPLYLMLFVLPILQAAGTNNAIYAVMINGAAAWIALLVACVTELEAAGRNSALAATASILAVALAAGVGTGGVMHNERGQELLLSSTTPIRRIPELRGIAVSPEQAHAWTELRDRIRPLTRSDAYRMVAYGDLAAYVFALGGRPIGNAWYSSGPDGLQSADLRARCVQGDPWGRNLPLVLTDRPLAPSEETGWRACGIDFSRAYRPVVRVQFPRSLTVWMARAARAGE